MRKKDDKKKKSFQTLYLSRRYNITELSKELGVGRTTLYKWKRQLFPTANENIWRKKMFVKLYNSGSFTIDEITGLLRMHPAKINEFKRKTEKYNIEILQSNIFNNNVLIDNKKGKG